VTVLDTEHLVAFALGVAIAAWWPTRPLEGASQADDLERELEELLSRAQRRG